MNDSTIYMKEWYDDRDQLDVWIPSSYTNAMVHPSAVIGPNVEIGDGTYIGPFCIIGYRAEHKDFWDKPLGRVIIGKNCRITGHVTIDAGTERATILGDNCFLLKHSHVGHDAEIGDDVTISCGAKIGGHAIIHSKSNIGLNACIHQRVRVPEGCMIGMNAAVTKTTALSSFRKYAGVPAKDIGSNSKGDLSNEVLKKAKEEFGNQLMWGDVKREALLKKIKENSTFQILGESQGKTIFVLKGIKTSPVMIYVPEEGKIYTSGLGLLCDNEDTLSGIFRLLGYGI